MFQEFESFSIEDCIRVRRTYLPKTCPLHYEKNPVKIVRAEKQYVYDDENNRFLDFYNCISHVGHCNKHVQAVANVQLRRFGTLDVPPNLYEEYVSRLLTTLPQNLTEVYFTQSGSTANQLAIELCQRYTKKNDVVVFDDCFLGNLLTVSELSIRSLKKASRLPKDWVHVLPCPNLFRGPYKESDAQAASKYHADAKKILDAILSNGKQVSCLISEPILTASGVFVPPAGYVKSLYQTIRNMGGLCIACETQQGLGRTGDYFWGFESQGAVPDIITIGKPLGNGYPMAAVITSAEIANGAGISKGRYRGNGMMWAIGSSVLDVLLQDGLMQNAKDLGSTLLMGLQRLLLKHSNIGDVRGMGLLIGVEIVQDKISRKSHPGMAEKITYRMREKRILIANSGPDMNILYLFPPLCISEGDVSEFLTFFDEIMTGIENQPFASDNFFAASSLITQDDLSPEDDLTTQTTMSDALYSRYSDMD